LQFLFVIQFFVSEAYFFESFTWGIIHMDFVGFLLGFPNLKMTSTTLNTSFHIDSGKFVGD